MHAQIAIMPSNAPDLPQRSRPSLAVPGPAAVQDSERPSQRTAGVYKQPRTCWTSGMGEEGLDFERDVFRGTSEKVLAHLAS
jgi:hypothetical protein